MSKVAVYFPSIWHEILIIPEILKISDDVRLNKVYSV
jgi:hypothetical protein